MHQEWKKIGLQVPSLCFMWQQIFGGQKNLPYEVVVRNQFQKRPAVLTDFFLRACAKFKKMIKKAMLQTYLFFRLIVSYDFIFYFWGKYEYRFNWDFSNFFFVNTQGWQEDPASAVAWSVVAPTGLLQCWIEI